MAFMIDQNDIRLRGRRFEAGQLRKSVRGWPSISAILAILAIMAISIPRYPDHLESPADFRSLLDETDSSCFFALSHSSSAVVCLQRRRAALRLHRRRFTGTT